MTDREIWCYLFAKTGNEYGTAAIMGNLMAESSMSPVCATGLKKAGFSNVSVYVKASDDGKHDFANDGVAFGFAQWCYHTRKQGLLNFVNAMGVSLADPAMQLEYLLKEMSGSYKSVWAAVTCATDIRTASDMIMLKYEKPANTSDAAKEKRERYGWQFYRKYGGLYGGVAESGDTAKKTKGKLVRAVENVNLRTGVGMNFAKVGVLKKGDTLELIGSKDGWYKAAVWISGDFAEKV